MIRNSAVAGRFYPGSSSALEEELSRLLDKKETIEEVIGLISPHAGYVYSGKVAGKIFSSVKVPDRVIILSPNHTGYGEPVSIISSGKWNIPTGDIPINEELASAIKNSSPLIKENSEAHKGEHSIEVQLPFIKFLNPNASFVPITIMPIQYSNCHLVGEAIAKAITGVEGKVLIIASSDMTHYETRENAGEKDMMAIDKILLLNPKGLYKTVTENHISMCGVIPVSIMLIASAKLGATSARLIDYRDSGEVNGDTNAVVGYAGIVLK